MESVPQDYVKMELVDHLVSTHMLMEHSLMDATAKSMENVSRILAVQTHASLDVQATRTQVHIPMDANAQ